MARDPVCGTFVVRERALWLGDGKARVFFCSDACRDAYRRGDASNASGSPGAASSRESAKGRTA
jgi:YHS domain-containing protein